MNPTLHKRSPVFTWCYLDPMHCSECRAVNCPALAAAPDPSNECSKRPLGTSAMGLATHQRGSHKMPLPPQPNCQRSLPTAPPGGGLTRRCQIDRGRAAGSHQAVPKSPAPVDLPSRAVGEHINLPIRDKLVKGQNRLAAKKTSRGELSAPKLLSHPRFDILIISDAKEPTSHANHFFVPLRQSVQSRRQSAQTALSPAGRSG